MLCLINPPSIHPPFSISKYPLRKSEPPTLIQSQLLRYNHYTYAASSSPRWPRFTFARVTRPRYGNIIITFTLALSFACTRRQQRAPALASPITSKREIAFFFDMRVRFFFLLLLRCRANNQSQSNCEAVFTCATRLFLKY